VNTIGAELAGMTQGTAIDFIDYRFYKPALIAAFVLLWRGTIKASQETLLLKSRPKKGRTPR